MFGSCFGYPLLSVIPSFAIISLRKRELVAYCSSRNLWFVRSVFVACPGHSYFFCI